MFNNRCLVSVHIAPEICPDIAARLRSEHENVRAREADVVVRNDRLEEILWHIEHTVHILDAVGGAALLNLQASRAIDEINFVSSRVVVKFELFLTFCFPINAKR